MNPNGVYFRLVSRTSNKGGNVSVQGIKKQEQSAQTKRRILDAATEEFSLYGVAGARIDRIARKAKANKSLIYDYFGNKDSLYQAVLRLHLAEVYQSFDFASLTLPEYAGRLFDFAMEHPQLMRLALWNGLEQDPKWPIENGLNADAQVSAIRAAQNNARVNDRYPPEFILTVIITVATAWTAANPFGISIAPHADRDRKALRDAVIRLITQICAD